MNERVFGKAIGGKARAKALTAEERSSIAHRAAATRWAGMVLKATHGSTDHPLKIGDIEIPCYMLNDETRVLSQRGLQAGIGMSVGGNPGGTGEARIVAFLRSLAQKGLETNDRS